jgi:hypothetical protein
MNVQFRASINAYFFPSRKSSKHFGMFGLARLPGWCGVVPGNAVAGVVELRPRGTVKPSFAASIKTSSNINQDIGYGMFLSIDSP